MSEPSDREANVDGFGAELLRRRQQALLTQESLAQLAGVDARTIRDIETGRTRRPRASTKRLLLDALPDEPTEHHQSGAVTPQKPPYVIPPAVTPFQLPADTAHFTGRSDQLDHLLDLWPRDPDRADDRDCGDTTRRTVVISAVDGMAGIGKTALAVHAAHHLAERFEDGVLFTDLHGYTPGAEPTSPAHALDTLLRGLGVPGDQIPPDLDARAALYRSVLAGRRVLIVLDNATDETQLQPLLPSTPECGVLVTSRRRLTGLDDATNISLPILPPGEAVALFRELVADRASAADHDTIDQIVSRCGHLPVAIRIAAARLRANPTSTPARLLAELINALDNGHGLDWLSDGHRAVAAVLEVSYRDLTPDQQHAFRLLGLHPGNDIEPYALAALAHTTHTHAQQLLDDLHAANLINQPVYHRYTLHDLVATYACNLAAADPATVRHRALSRLFDHYAHATSLAMNLAYPWEADLRPPTPPTAAPVPSLGDARHARQWLDSELDNFLAAAHHAPNQDRADHAIHQSATLRRHLRNCGRHTAGQALHDEALQHARAIGDRSGEQTALHGLADTYSWQGRYVQAVDCCERLLSIARESGNRAGELAALSGLGTTHRAQDRYGAAADFYQQLLTIACEIGHRDGEQEARTAFGDIYRAQGQYEQAADSYEQALAIARQIGNRTGELAALAGLGLTRRAQRHLTLAADYFEQVLAIARESGDRNVEPGALCCRGEIHLALDQYGPAADCFQQALTIACQIGVRNYQCAALNGLGRLDHARGHHDDSLNHLNTALKLAIDLDQPADQTRAHDGLAHTYHSIGDTTRAHQHWNAALDILTRTNINHTEDPDVNTVAIQAHLATLNRDQRSVEQVKH